MSSATGISITRSEIRKLVDVLKINLLKKKIKNKNKKTKKKLDRLNINITRCNLIETELSEPPPRLHLYCVLIRR